MPRSKNLLKNHRAKNGLRHWEVTSNGGHGFKCEEEPVGCKDIDECTHLKANFGCWATSFGPCLKHQIIKLREHGIRNRRMDTWKPPITVCDWYCPRKDCGGVFNMKVELLADDKSTVLDSWSFSETMEAGATWKKMRHVFRNYPSGVRFVKFEHGGNDTKNLVGHFGIKFTNSGLFVGRREGSNQDIRPKYDTNLLKNPCAKEGLSNWEVVKNEGNGFCYEDSPGGCKSICAACSGADHDCCWATSHGDCEKKQMIDLEEHGFNTNLLDNTEPEIEVFEWYGSRSDAGCKHWLKVRLLNENKEEMAVRYYMDKKPAEGDWFKVEFSFNDYGPGLRYIEYTHGGADTRNWAGHYGAKIACSSVMICAEGDSTDDEA
ncbi:F-box only protein [Mactra antiquata]